MTIELESEGQGPRRETAMKMSTWWERRARKGEKEAREARNMAGGLRARGDEAGAELWDRSADMWERSSASAREGAAAAKAREIVAA